MMTTKPMVVVAGVEREMNDEEYAQYLKDQKDFAKEKADKLAAQEAAQAAKEAAQAKLAVLGLTVDDLKALGL